jgi:hypothetical protein
MPSAIQQIVDAYVRLKNRGALEDLRAHRQRLAHDLRARNGFDFSVPAGQIDDEIAAIEAGLERLNRVHSRRERPNVWMIDQAGGASTIARRSFQLRPDSPQQATDMRDVSKLKFIGSSFCTQYQSDAPHRHKTWRMPPDCDISSSFTKKAILTS